jgi:hypothetical protein
MSPVSPNTIAVKELGVGTALARWTRVLMFNVSRLRSSIEPLKASTSIGSALPEALPEKVICQKVFVDMRNSGLQDICNFTS